MHVVLGFKKNLYFLVLLFFFVQSISAEITPKHILLEKCRFNYTKMYKHLKKNKAFVYARVALGEEEYCTWTQDMHSMQSAQKIALEACMRYDINATCKIIDINDRWIVSKGDFSLIVPPDNTPLPPQKKKAIAVSVSSFVLGECFELFGLHLDHAGHKVFAYSIDEDGRFACGISKNQQTLRRAAILALQRCETQREQMQKDAPNHQCLSLSDGKTLLAGIRDFNITLDKKQDIFLTQEDFLQKVKQARDMLSVSCLEQYRYYLRNKNHKAFYIAKENKDSLVCGLSFDKFTIASAKKEAYSRCQNAAKRKHVNANCYIFSLDAKENR